MRTSSLPCSIKSTAAEQYRAIKRASTTWEDRREAVADHRRDERLAGGRKTLTALNLALVLAHDTAARRASDRKRPPPSALRDYFAHGRSMASSRSSPTKSGLSARCSGPREPAADPPAGATPTTRRSC